jgi:thiol-disulfide isomerase/thioredoxin
MRSDLAIGTRAPDWKLKTVDGKSVRLSDLRGKVVVLDFWANWCGSCIKLMPLFDELESQYRERQVEFFTLSIWPEQFDPAAFLRDHKMSSTFLIGDNEVAREYRIWGLPTYFVIDRMGNISYVHVLLSTEPEPLRKRMREAIEKSLI